MGRKENRYLAYASVASQISTALAGPIILGYFIGRQGVKLEYWGTFGWNVSVFLGIGFGMVALVLTIMNLVSGENK